MKKRVVGLVVVSIVLTFATAAGGIAQTGRPSELGTLVAAFFDADMSTDVVVVNDPFAGSPFGGPSQLPPNVLEPVTIVETFEFVVNPGPFPGFNAGGIDLFTDDFGDAVDFSDGPFLQEFVPPYIADGFETPADFLDDLLGEDIDLITGDGEISDRFPLGPIILRGARMMGMFPSGGCGAFNFEVFTGDAIAGAPQWEAPDFAPNDLFGGLSVAYVTPCEDGEWQDTEMRVNTGTFFETKKTAAMTAIFENGFLQIIPAFEVSGSEGVRFGGFVTDAANPFLEDTVGFTTAPPYPDLFSNEPPRVYFANPFPGIEISPIGLNFGDSANGAPGFTGNFGITIDPEPVSDNMAEFGIQMVQFATMQLTKGSFTFDPDTGAYEGSLFGSGNGYSEEYSFKDGAYTYDFGTAEVYPQSVEPGSDEDLIGLLRIEYEKRDLAANPPVTSPPEVTPPTDAPDVGATDGPEATGAITATTDSPDSGGSFPVLPFGALGVIAGLGWWFFLRKRVIGSTPEK